MTAEQRIRAEWAESLAEHMALKDMTVKGLVDELKKLGVGVSRQAVELWLKAETSPRPHVQAALGTVLEVPASRLFRIENMPKTAAS